MRVRTLRSCLTTRFVGLAKSFLSESSMLQHDQADSVAGVRCATSVPWSLQGTTADLDAECMAHAAQMFIASRVAQVLAEQSGCLRTSQLIKLLAEDFDLPEEMGYDAHKLCGFLGCWSDDFVLVPGPPGIADSKDAGIGLRSLLNSFDEFAERDGWIQQDWCCDTMWPSWDSPLWWQPDSLTVEAPDFSAAAKLDQPVDTISACSTAAQTPCVAPDSCPPVLCMDLMPELGLPEADTG
mmetsp:Transcript_86150/g.230716  ORF Transcript_86150/g.230716 Transcript_86150/m.230716 type:complete len:239 (-) Transcript_86150:227-943(-)